MDFERFLNAVTDWSEKNDTPVEIYRDEEGVWQFGLTFKDSRGFFYGQVSYFERKDNIKVVRQVGRSQTRTETDGELTERIVRALHTACVAARHHRVNVLNGRGRAALYPTVEIVCT